ncbi:DoxX family protein [Caulobacter sp. S45]|uniref:DoxX family protein n=1 Tax=Caulobacter sp. S45 TaxID=1641861 RepID=UPI0015758C4B|nr:DoxX family protein [Caulobacter sp. S45]
MKFVSAVIGSTLAAAGLAKLLRVAAYEDLVQDLDWSDEERQAIGVSELVGGLLMLAGPTRRLGVGVVLAASGAALAVELRSDQTQLSTPRAGIMLATLLVGAAA